MDWQNRECNPRLSGDPYPKSDQDIDVELSREGTSTPIPDCKSFEMMPCIFEIEEEEQIFMPLQVVETQQIVAMDSVARVGSEFWQLINFLIKVLRLYDPQTFQM